MDNIKVTYRNVYTRATFTVVGRDAAERMDQLAGCWVREVRPQHG